MAKKLPKCTKNGPPDAPEPVKTNFLVVVGWGGGELLLTQAKKHVLYPFLTFEGLLAPKMCVFRPFPALAQKIYFIHLCQPGKYIMSLLKQNIQIPPPS